VQVRAGGLHQALDEEARRGDLFFTDNDLLAISFRDSSGASTANPR